MQPPSHPITVALSVIVVSFNTREILRACLQRLFEVGQQVRVCREDLWQRRAAAGREPPVHIVETMQCQTDLLEVVCAGGPSSSLPR